MARNDVLMRALFRMFVVSVWPSDDLRIEEHACGRLRAKRGIDETFGVNFSDAPVGAVCNKNTAVFGDGDLLRRVQFGGHGLFAVAAESCFSCAGDGCDDSVADDAQAIVAAV